MSSISQYKDKLLSSHGVNSLAKEEIVYNAFKQAGWHVRHSTFYKDTKEGKIREVDVKASKSYSSVNFYHEFFFVVEVKSLKKMSVIVASLNNPYSPPFETSSILTDSFDNYYRLIKSLTDLKLSSHDLQKIIHGLNAYLNSKNRKSRDKFAFFDPYKIPMFSSFREDNGDSKAEKSENYNLWSSILSLNSYINYLKFEFWEMILYTSTNKFRSGQLDINHLAVELIDNLGYIETYHPIIVIDAPLWKYKDNDLSPIKYCRLEFGEIRDMINWVDLVTFDGLDEYIALTDYYNKEFKSRGFSYK